MKTILLQSIKAMNKFQFIDNVKLRKYVNLRYSINQSYNETFTVKPNFCKPYA